MSFFRSPKLILTIFLIVFSLYPGFASGAQSEISDTFTTIVWSHDGSRIATGQMDGTVKIWDASAQTLLLTLTGHTDRIVGMSWSPDDHKLGSVGWDLTGRIWDTGNGTLLYTLTGHESYVGAITWSPDGLRIITGSMNEASNLRVWDAASGQQIDSKETGSIVDFAWSPSGNQLVSANPVGYIEFLSGSSFDLLARYKNQPKRYGKRAVVNRVAWQSAGDYVASGDVTGTVIVRDIITGDVKFDLPATANTRFDYYTTNVQALIFSPDGQFIQSVTADGTVREWDIATGKLVEDRQSGVSGTAAAWSPYGVRVAYSTDNPSNTTKLAIITPVFSFDKLTNVAEQCMAGAKNAQSSANSLDIEKIQSLTVVDLPDFITQLKAIPTGNIPDACVADLIAVSEAIINQPE